tara:strand:+ start:37977 stop:39233 length:1257 start_codon:yes stop_codon:yes gene_type:complete
MKIFETKNSTNSKKSNFIPTALVLITMLTFGVSNTNAQNKKELVEYEKVKDIENYGSFKYAEVIGHGGSHFYSGQTLDEALANGYGALEVRLGWKSGDPESWSNKYYNSMSYGVGFYSGFLGDPAVLGNPNALYGFLDMPLGRQDFNKRTRWIFSPALGLTYNLVAYNPSNNPTNDAIGASFAVYISFAGKGETTMTRDMDITYGIDFTHFSNGRSFMPNYGLNMLGFNIGAKYHFNAAQKRVNKDPYTSELLQSRYKRTPNIKVPKKVTHSINILTAVGTVQNGFDENEKYGDPNNRYTTFSGYVDYTYKWDIKHGLDAGIDFFYDQSLIIETPEDPNDISLMAYHFGYKYTFWRITVIAQLGGYFGDDKGKGKLWSRPGVQYKISDWVSAHVALKTRRGFAADWAEFGVAFHPFNW